MSSRTRGDRGRAPAQARRCGPLEAPSSSSLRRCSRSPRRSERASPAYASAPRESDARGFARPWVVRNVCRMTQSGRTRTGRGQFRPDQLHAGDADGLSQGHAILSRALGRRRGLSTRSAHDARARRGAGDVSERSGRVHGVPPLAIECASDGQDEHEIRERIDDPLRAVAGEDAARSRRRGRVRSPLSAHDGAIVKARTHHYQFAYQFLPPPSERRRGSACSCSPWAARRTRCCAPSEPARARAASLGPSPRPTVSRSVHDAGGGLAHTLLVSCTPTARIQPEAIAVAMLV